MYETITLPAGWVAIPLDEYRYLLSLLPVKDAPKPKPKPEAQPKPKYGGRQLKLTDEQIGQMNALRLQGVSVTKISEKFGVSEQTVRNYLAAYAEKHPDVAHKFAVNMTPDRSY